MLHAPISHPFIERLLGTIRRVCLDAIVFWNDRDLKRKLEAFKIYDNDYRVHQGLDGNTHGEIADA